MSEEEIKNLEEHLKSLPTIKQNMSIPVATTFGINLDELTNAIKELKKIPTLNDLLRENKKIKEDISFCLKSIEQEMKMSTDSRTRKEMKTCFQILKKWGNK